MKLLVINGPNLNMLGKREPTLYGKEDYSALCKRVRKKAKSVGVKVKIIQSNYEGKIVTVIQKARGKFDGIIINAGALTHTSLAVLDALKAAEVPAAEVHLTDIAAREEFRKFSYVGLYAEVLFRGLGINGDLNAVDYFVNKNKRR